MTGYKTGPSPTRRGSLSDRSYHTSLMVCISMSEARLDRGIDMRDMPIGQLQFLEC